MYKTNLHKRLNVKLLPITLLILIVLISPLKSSGSMYQSYSVDSPTYSYSIPVTSVGEANFLISASQTSNLISNDDASKLGFETYRIPITESSCESSTLRSYLDRLRFGITYVLYPNYDVTLKVQFESLITFGSASYFEADYYWDGNGNDDRFDDVKYVWTDDKGTYICLHMVVYTSYYNDFWGKDTPSKHDKPIVWKVYGNKLETGVLNEGVEVGENLGVAPFNYNIFVLTLIAIPLIRRKLK